MAKKKAIYYPVIIGLILPYLQNIFSKLTASLAAKYGTDAGFMTTLSGWLTALENAINKATADQATAEASTKAQNELIVTIHEAVFAELDRIQKHGSFDEADMEDLGARKVHTPPDLNTVKPKITHVTILMTKVILDWIKGPMDGVIIYGSYDGVTFVEIGRDTKSPWEDERLNRTPHVAEVRYYKLRYMKDDQPVGLETDVLKVVVDIN